jgi:hypothetical protein
MSVSERRHWRANVLPPQALSAVGSGIGASLGPVLLAAGVTAVPVFFHLTSQAAAIAACVGLGMIVAGFAVPAAPVVLIFAYVFQNFFVALVSPDLGSVDALNAIRAYNFLLTLVVWLILAGGFWLRRPGFPRAIRRLIGVTTAALVLIGVYFVLGAVGNPNSAIVYLRNVATPFLLFQICLLAASRHRLSVVGPLTVVAALALLYGYVELGWHDELLRLFNGDSYLGLLADQGRDAGVWLRALQETGRVFRDYRDTLVVDFLNTPLLGDLGFQVYRLEGPNFHPISFAYVLAGFGIVLGAARRWWYGLLALPLLLVIGSKGALILLVATTAALVAVRVFGRRLGMLACLFLLAAYAAFGIILGIRSGDYHVIGLIGGLNGFLANPLGHGLGAGGNLSLNVSALDWTKSQSVGSTDVAVESAVGVLLYQMGIAGIALLGVLAWLATRLWGCYRLTLSRAHAIGAFALLTMIVNGLFQEEALFAPLALGLIAAFAGLLLGSDQLSVTSDQ